MTRKPPFRAEHVGSLLRPRALHDARAAFDGDLRRTVSGGEGRSSPALRPIEDAAIVDAVTLQERAGLQSITDGEYRRRSWYQDFVLGLESTAVRFEIGPLSFADDHGNRAPTPRICVEGKLRRRGPIMVDAFTFLNKTTNRTPKVTMPAPSELHFFGGRDVIDRSTYPDLEEFWADLVTIYGGGVADAFPRRLPLVFRFDDCSFPLLCDPKFQAAPSRAQRRTAAPESIAPSEHAPSMRFAPVWAARGGTFVSPSLSRQRPRTMSLGPAAAVAVASPTWLSKVTSTLKHIFLNMTRPPPPATSDHFAMPRGKAVVLRLVSSKSAPAEVDGEPEEPDQGSEGHMPLDDGCT